MPPARLRAALDALTAGAALALFAEPLQAMLQATVDLADQGKDTEAVLVAWDAAVDAWHGAGRPGLLPPPLAMAAKQP